MRVACVCVTSTSHVNIDLTHSPGSLTLLVEFPDDSVQVGVLERNVTASHGHFGAEWKDFSDTCTLLLKNNNKIQNGQEILKVRGGWFLLKDRRKMRVFLFCCCWWWGMKRWRMMERRSGCQGDGRCGMLHAGNVKKSVLGYRKSHMQSHLTFEK